MHHVVLKLLLKMLEDRVTLVRWRCYKGNKPLTLFWPLSISLSFLVTHTDIGQQRYRYHRDVGDSKLVASYRCWFPTLMWKNRFMLISFKWPNHHQHHIVITNIFRLQYPLPTSMLSFEKSSLDGLSKLSQRASILCPDDEGFL